jgi:hypothetical protein
MCQGLGRGSWLGQVLPATIGTDAVRIAAIASHASLGDSVRSVVTDRMIGLLSLVVATLLLLPFSVRATGNDAAVSSVYAVSFGALAALCLCLLFPRLLAFVPLVGKFGQDIAARTRLTLASQTGGWTILLSALVHMLAVLYFAVLAHAVGSPMSIVASLSLATPAMLVSAIPISLGGWGVREAIFGTSFSFVGADPVSGITVSILFGVGIAIGGAMLEILARLASASNVIHRS